MSERTFPWVVLDKPQPTRIERTLAERIRTEFVFRGDRRWDVEADLATDLYKKYLINQSPKESYQSYLNLFLGISLIHQHYERQFKPRSTQVFNGFQNTLPEYLALDHAQNFPPGFIDQIGNQSEALRMTTGPDHWFYPKVYNLFRASKGMERLYTWIDFMQAKLSPALKSVDLAVLRSDASDVWSSVQTDRGYGVKNCFFPSPLFLPRDQVFYVTDENMSTQDRLILAQRPPNGLAIVGIGSTPKPAQNIEPIAKRNISHGAKNTVDFHTVEIGDVLIGSSFDNNGRIRLSAFAQIPLEEAFRRKDAIASYEMWRLFMFMRMHDLTRRADLVDTLPSLDEFEKEIAKGTWRFTDLASKVRQIDYRRLILPRTKPAVPQISVDVTIEQSQRFVDRHKVVWFTRRLPQGYNASEQAREYAKEHNVTLRPGETIVREHYRGKPPADGVKPSDRATKAKFKKPD